MFLDKLVEYSVAQGQYPMLGWSPGFLSSATRGKDNWYVIICCILYVAPTWHHNIWHHQRISQTVYNTSIHDPRKLYTTNRNLRRVYTATQDIIRYHTTINQDPNRFDTNTTKIPTDFFTKPPTKTLNNFTFSATKAPEDCAQRPNAGAGPTSSRGFFWFAVLLVWAWAKSQHSI